MFRHTDLPDAPWTVIKSNDKKRARLEAMRYVLSLFDYEGQDASDRRPTRPADRRRVSALPELTATESQPVLEPLRRNRIPAPSALAGYPAHRRRRPPSPLPRSLVTWYSAIPAATPAFSDSAPLIGILTTASHCWATSLDRPLPSEPITSTSGPSARSARRCRRPLRVEADHEQAGLGVGGQGPRQVRRLGDRHPGQRAGRGLPRPGGHPGRPPRRHQHAVAAERRHRPRRPRRGCAGRSCRPARRSAAGARQSGPVDQSSGCA